VDQKDFPSLTYFDPIGRAGGLGAGVPEAWFVDTASRSVLVFRRSRPDRPTFDVGVEVRADEELTSPLLPGFALRAATIFG
jgi:Uma2 family endonuclease